jgi:hypothetical protein
VLGKLKFEVDALTCQPFESHDVVDLGFFLVCPFNLTRLTTPVPRNADVNDFHRFPVMRSRTSASRPSPSSDTARARNRVGGHQDARPPLTTPLRPQSRTGCTTMLGRHPPATPLALAIAWGVYHDTRLPPTP